jgi:hypothetical protein
MDYSGARRKLVEWMRKQLIGPAVNGSFQGIDLIPLSWTPLCAQPFKSLGRLIAQRRV